MQAATRIASLGDAAWDEPQLPAAQARSATARHPCFVCVLRRQRRRPSRQRSFAQPNPALSSATEAPVRRVRPLPPFLSPVFWVVSVQVGLKRDEMLLLRPPRPATSSTRQFAAAHVPGGHKSSKESFRACPKCSAPSKLRPPGGVRTARSRAVGLGRCRDDGVCRRKCTAIPRFVSLCAALVFLLAPYVHAPALALFF